METKNSPNRVNMESSRLEEERYDQLTVVKLLDAAVENISDYSMWLDRLIQEIEQQNPQINSCRYELFKEDKRFDVIKATIWTKQLEDIQQQMLKTDEYKKQMEIKAKEAEDAVSKVKEIHKQLDVAKKYKMSAEKKIRDLHAKANKLPTLELLNKNLKEELQRSEKAKMIITEKFKEKQNKELRQRTNTDSTMRMGNESFTNNRDPSISTDKQLGYGKMNTMQHMNENVENVKYNFKTKTENSSLKGLVQYLNKELIEQKNKNLSYRLFNFKQKAKNFEKMTQMYNSGVKLSRGPIEPVKESKKKRVSQVNPLTNLLESNFTNTNTDLQVLVEESEEGSINEGN